MTNLTKNFLFQPIKFICTENVLYIISYSTIRQQLLVPYLNSESDLDFLGLFPEGLGQLFNLIVHSLYQQVNVLGLFLQVFHILVIFSLQLLWCQVFINMINTEFLMKQHSDPFVIKYKEKKTTNKQFAGIYSLKAISNNYGVNCLNKKKKTRAKRIYLAGKLVSTTNIICADLISPKHAGKFLEGYGRLVVLICFSKNVSVSKTDTVLPRKKITE